MYDIVFVVLVYRNTDDLNDFFLSNHLPNTKTIVVNSFYDERTEKVFKELAENNGADFISVPNKGYGAGNNKGIEYALSNYDFQYLIISNADITIQHFAISDIKKFNNSIIAPNIISADGKRQNPCSPYMPSRLEIYLRYLTYKNHKRKMMFIFYALSRIKKTLFHLLYPLQKSIFAAHGAFVIIPKTVISDLLPLYNERMFLFGEETHLAFLANQSNIKTYYVPEVVIRHKEDGSMKVASVNIFENERASYIELYNYWLK